MTHRRPVQTGLGIVLLIGAALINSGCSRHSGSAQQTDSVRPAKVVAVGVTDSNTRTYPGRVQAARRVSLAFRVGGPVAEILVSKGQRVASGQILARIDPRDFDVQVLRLEAQLTAVRAQQTQAGEEYQRVRGLFEHDNASKSDFDRAKAALDVTKAQVAATEQALRAARLSLADTELKAPYAGIVADRLVDVHQTVTPGESVVHFQDLRAPEVVIDVPEREVAELTANEPKGIVIRFDPMSGGEEIPARVKEYATQADPQTQTFPVTLQLDRQPTVDLLPGMTASVDWLSGNGNPGRGAMVVPLASVATDDSGQAFVWRVVPDTETVERVAVATGDLTDSGLEVLSGLEQSDRILAAGVHFVTEGQQIRPIDSDAGE